MFNEQIHTLKNNLEHQDSRFGLELEGLKSMIEMKNEEIVLLQKEIVTNLDNNMKER
jgi:hypothetical protein